VKYGLSNDLKGGWTRIAILSQLRGWLFSPLFDVVGILSMWDWNNTQKCTVVWVNKSF